jgi:D-tyrosyl-tRNA(Tyr) deacylase
MRCRILKNNKKEEMPVRAVVTRVKHASVTIEGTVRGQIGEGYLVLLGVAPADTEETALKLADKICNLRIFEDENEKMNLNLEQVGGSLLVISQFTLFADTSSRRPGFSGAAKPDVAIPLYEKFMAHCRERGFTVEHGEFGAKMEVDSLNHGPVTIVFDTEKP